MLQKEELFLLYLFTHLCKRKSKNILLKRHSKACFITSTKNQHVSLLSNTSKQSLLVKLSLTVTSISQTPPQKTPQPIFESASNCSQLQLPKAFFKNVFYCHKYITNPSKHMILISSIFESASNCSEFPLPPKLSLTKIKSALMSVHMAAFTING